MPTSSFSPAYLMVLPQVAFQLAGTITLTFLLSKSRPVMSIVIGLLSVTPPNIANSSAEKVISLFSVPFTVIVHPASRTAVPSLMRIADVFRSC